MTVRRKIFLLSCFAHVLFFAFFLVYKKQDRSFERKIIVKNYHLEPAPPLIVQHKAPKPVLKKSVVKKPKPKVTKPAKQKTASTKKKPKPLPNPNILKDLEKALASLETKSQPEKISHSLKIPKAVQKYKIETMINTAVSKSFNTQALVAYLEDNLELPEKGAVRIEIHLQKNGSFKSLTVLDSQSDKNAKYLKNRLPQLTFPCLNAGDQTEVPINFIVCFKNL